MLTDFPALAVGAVWPEWEAWEVLTDSANLEGVHDLLAKLAAQLAQLGDWRRRHEPWHTLQCDNGLLRWLVHA